MTDTRRILLAGFLGLAACAALAGCASPGPPLPPTLKLPEVVAASELSATRVGDEVQLHWTTPERTTDKLLIVGPITAEICRETQAAAPAQVATATAKASALCSVVERMRVAAGAAADAVDKLPPALAEGPVRRLAYRVQLRNAAGRTAGPSPAVYAAAGAAPLPVEGLQAKATKAGVVLKWKWPVGDTTPEELNAHPELLQSALSTTVELTRTTLGAASDAVAQPQKKTGLPGAAGMQTSKEPQRFTAGNVDAGGTIDRTVEIGGTYTYTAQRVRSVTVVNNQTVESRSAVSAAVTVAVRDVFPPEVPAGLVAVPGFDGEGAAARPAIDLSWEPDVEPELLMHLAGYRVYRQVASADGSRTWQKLGQELVTETAYRDLTVMAGQTYTYRVTAVSTAGNESAPSAEASETAAGTQ